MQSVFPNVNLNNLKWQIKRLLTLLNIGSNKINKKQSKMNQTRHDIRYT